MRGHGAWKWTLAVALFLVCAPVNESWANGLGIRLETGTVLPYGAPEEVGNGAAAHLTYDLASVQFSLGAGLVFPGSRVDRPLRIAQAMTQWHPARTAAWAQRLSLSPYVSLGLGLASFEEEEELSEPPEAVDSVRWIDGNDQLMGLLGLGLAYGSAEHLVLTVEARAVNHTHLGFLLGAGTRF